MPFCRRADRSCRGLAAGRAAWCCWLSACFSPRRRYGRRTSRAGRNRRSNRPAAIRVHPLYGELELPKMGKNPPDPGMTLDQAIERLLKENLELRAAHDEIDMAEADIEAAGQPPRASLFIDVEIDGIRARTARAHEVLPRRWFDTLVARRRGACSRRSIRTPSGFSSTSSTRLSSMSRRRRIGSAFAESGLRGLGQLLERTEILHERGQVGASEVAQLRVARERATVALGDSEANLKKTRLVLGNLLNLPDADVERLRVRSDLEQFTDPGREPPAAEELIRRALHHRPDLRAYRLGVGGASGLVEGPGRAALPDDLQPVAGPT